MRIPSASAFAVLARAVGIPTRVVNGFLGGEWNEYQGYVAVRAGDAHSWDEVYFAGAGWVTFDATPSGQEELSRGGSGVRARIGRFLDTLRFQCWTKWVIEYDLTAQLGLLKDVGALFKRGAVAVKDALGEVKRTLIAYWPLALAGALAIGFAIWWRRRGRGVDGLTERSRTRARTRSTVAEIYDQVARTLAKSGAVREPATTPRELAAALDARGAAAAAQVRELVDLYYAAEWGGRRDPGDESRAAALALEIRAALAAAAPRDEVTSRTTVPVPEWQRVSWRCAKLSDRSERDSNDRRRSIDGPPLCKEATPMSRPSMRIAGLLAVALTGLSAIAVADTGSLPSGMITFPFLFIHENGSAAQAIASTPTVQAQYFNLAHCVCAQAGAGSEQTFAQEIGLTGFTSEQFPVPLQIWLGTECDVAAAGGSDALRMMECTQITSPIANYETLEATPAAPEISLYTLMNPNPSTATGMCAQATVAETYWVLADTDQDGILDFSASTSINTDTLPPPLPTDFSAEGGESAIQINWTPPVTTDIYYYQAFCADNQGMPPASPAVSPRYVVADQLCGVSQGLTLTPSAVTVTSSVDAGVVSAVDAGTSDAGVPSGIPTGLATLDPSFLCGEATATASSMRLTGLTNGVPYTVAVIVTDLAGNPAGTYFTSSITPQPVIDFWEDLHERGSKVEGGFCLLASTFGDDSGLTNLLRDFRDNTLGGTRFGQWLTSLYYSTLAPLGEYVQGSIALRIVAGVLLAPLVAVALAWHFLTLPGLLLAIAFVWGYRRRRRILRARGVVPARRPLRSARPPARRSPPSS